MATWTRSYLISVCFFILFGCAAGEKAAKPVEEPGVPTVAIDKGIDKLADEVSVSLAAERRPKIAVVDLLGPNVNHTQLGAFISEKLITRLFKSGRFEKVLERKLLHDLLVQQKVEMEGYFDQDTVKSICGKIGIDAMVMGFIIDCGSRGRGKGGKEHHRHCSFQKCASGKTEHYRHCKGL